MQCVKRVSEVRYRHGDNEQGQHHAGSQQPWQCLKRHLQLCIAQEEVLVAKFKPQRSYSRSPVCCKLDSKEVPMGDSRAGAAGPGDPSCERVHTCLK